MEQRYPHDEFDEQGARQEAARFEASIAAEQPIFLDSNTIENIYVYYRIQNELGKAEQLIRYALNIYHTNADLHYRMASLQADQGKLEAAMDSIDYALALQPHISDYIALKARIMALMGNATEAFALIQNALDADTQPAELYYHQGLLYQQEKRYDEAVVSFEKALESDPEYEFVLSEILFCHELNAKNQAAERFLQRYLDNNPFSANGWYNMGMLYLKSGRYEQAVSAFDYGLAVDETFTSLYIGKGSALMELGRFDLAARTFLEALSFEGRDISTMLNLAECYENLQQYKRARFYYRKITEQYNGLPDAWFGIASTLEAEEKYLQAIYYYKKAIEHYEDYYEAWVGVADCEYEVGNLMSAFEALSKAVEIVPDDTELWMDWAEKLYDDGHEENALALLEEGLETNPQNADLLYQYAAYALKAGVVQDGYAKLENALLLDYEAHTVLFEYFPQLSSLKPVQLLLQQYRPK